MQESDPPYLHVGTDVSAKYKGAFCEAKIRKVVRVVKCKVTFKSGLGTVLLSDDQIKGSLRVGANVEARHPDKNTYIEAVINKIQDCSQYTVVFDDGDITTLRRSALCLKSGRHFNEGDTLDHLPLTHPEHFSNPVVGGRRNVRRRRDALSGELIEGDESSDGESSVASKKGKRRFNQDDGDVDIGKVVCVEVTDKKKGKDNWFPGVIVSPSAQETVKIRTKDEYLVRSFRDGRYYTVPKKEITSFSKDSHGVKNDSNSNILKAAIEKAVQFIDKNELPAHWDKDVLFSAVDEPTEAPSEDPEASESEDSEEDNAQAEVKDLFVAKLYKYMEERGTPINKVPVVVNRDLDLHKLYKVVIGRGGYNKVTNSSQWKSVTVKMGFGSMPSTSTINLVKQGYKKFIHNFEEFTRKLGCNFPVGSSSSSSSRSNRIMFRDRHASSSSTRETKKEEAKVSPKEETVTAEIEEVAPPPPVATPPPPTPATEEVEPKKPEAVEDTPPRRVRSRQENRQRTKEEETLEKEKPLTAAKKRRSLVTKEKEEKEVVAVPPPLECPPPSSPTPPPSVSPTKRISGRGKYKRKTEKEEVPEPVLTPEEYPAGREFIGKDVQVQMGDKLSVYYGKESEGKKYEAKVVDVNEKQGLFFVHYAGWNNRYDEWIPRYRVAENLSLRTEQVTSIPQGRGPSHSSTSDGTVSDSGTFKGPAAGKGVRKKLKPSLPSAMNTTRSKSGVTPRKRLSSEGDATASKRHTRKRGALSGGESGGESSESEEKAKSPKRIRKPKKMYDPGTIDRSKSIPSPDILDYSKEGNGKQTEETTPVIDINQLRLEMKGIDKMVKISLPTIIPGLDLPIHAAQEKTKPDVYDFKDEKDVHPPKIEEGTTEKVEISANDCESPVAPKEEEVKSVDSQSSPKEIEKEPPPVVEKVEQNQESEKSEIPPLMEVRVDVSTVDNSSGKSDDEVKTEESVTEPPKSPTQQIEIAKVEVKGPPPALLHRPSPPALIRATTPIAVPPPIRSVTPITISVPLRSQRPILIKSASPSTSTILLQPPAPATAAVHSPRMQIIPRFPLIPLPKVVPLKEPTPLPEMIPKLISADPHLISEPVAVSSATVTLITTRTTTSAGIRPKLVEGPKLASYPTARIRAASGILPIRPSTATTSSSSGTINIPLQSGLSGIKKRRKVKSQKFIESSESSDEDSNRKQQKKRHVYAPKSQFKPANLQGSQLSTTAPSTRVLVQGSSTVSTTIAAVSSNLIPSSSLLIPKKGTGSVAKVTPIVKVQLAMEKRPISPGNKIVSGKYTRVEQPVKINKKTNPSPAVKSLTTGVPKQQSVIVKKVQITQLAPFSTTSGKSVGQAVGLEAISKQGTIPVSSNIPTADPVEPEEPFIPFKSSMQEQKTDMGKLEFQTESGQNVEAKTRESGGDMEDVKGSSPLVDISAPEEESCHSLLCEEEIPGSPTPGSEPKAFSFDYTNPTELTSQVVSRAESVIIQSVSSVIVPNTQDKVQVHPSPPPPGTEKSQSGMKPSDISVQGTPPPPLLQISERGAFSSVSRQSQASEMQVQQMVMTPPKYPSEGEDNPIENSPRPRSTSSSISTGSPRGGDGERLSASGENSKSKEHSDTDSIDCLPKSGEIPDENSSSDEGEPKSDRGMRRSRSPSSSPRKRRLARESPDECESPPRSSYRGSHRSSIRRLDTDYGRMPPPQPPVNLGKPPRSDKYNFIPELSDDMTSEERVEIVQNSMAALREKYKELKTELSVYDRKKKRIRKREREREKRDKEAVKPATSSTSATLA